MSKSSVRQHQEQVYRDLYNQHKGTPMAVSSESWEHKKLRFSKIAEIFQFENELTLHDVGMGLGDFFYFVKNAFPDKIIHYSGTEILEEYVKECEIKFPESKFFQRDIADKPGEDIYDYVIMSGVFHQRREIAIRDWEAFSQKIIKNSFQMCRKGLAFNFVSPFVDFYQTQSYYCNLPKLLNFINDDLSRFFEIRHNYALFEFTVFVYKEEHIKNIYPQTEFAKYFKSK
ncbi:MAG: class I SAM-dependent methyltransferase [Cytophagales bacterium]